VVKALEDKDPSVRFSASDALGRLGNPSAIPYLESAIAKEQEETIRSQLQADLQTLRQKTESHN
jgi:HEAT repeat protein